MEIAVINERTSGNILSDLSRKLDFSNIPWGVLSNEGFAENPEQQKKLSHFLIRQFSLQRRGPLLDIGYGANIHIANTFSRQGISAYALDILDSTSPGTSSCEFQPPKIVHINNFNVTILCGDSADVLDQESDIKNIRFGTVCYNGSWTSGGNNWTVAGEVLWGKYNLLENKSLSFADYINIQLDRHLTAIANILTNDGILGIVSSRYAFHGAGYDFSQLPKEKMSFLDAYERLSRLGANKFWIVGLTQAGMNKVIENSSHNISCNNRFAMSSKEIEAIQRQLQSVESLSSKDLNACSTYGDATMRMQNVLRAAKDVPEFNAIARIDALFAEF